MNGVETLALRNSPRTALMTSCSASGLSEQISKDRLTMHKTIMGILGSGLESPLDVGKALGIGGGGSGAGEPTLGSIAFR